MDTIDSNKNNQIDYSEFVAAAIDKQMIITRESLKACFSLFDINQDGSISIKEFRQMLEGETKRPDEDWSRMITEVTKDPNREEINFVEFEQLLLLLIK